MSGKSSHDEKRPLGFVNRRGHNADISSAELDDLSIDAQPEPKNAPDQSKPHTSKAKAKQKTTKSKKPKTRRHAKWTRKKTIILVAVVLAIIAIPVLIGETLRAQYAASTTGAHASLKAIIANDVLPMQKKSDISSKQVVAVNEKLETVRDEMCPGGLLDNMAALYPRAKTAHQECIDERGKIASLVTQMRDMASMLAYIEALNAALAPVNTPSTDAFAVIANQQTSWQQASDNVQKIAAPSSMKLTHEQLVAAVKSINEGWSKLNIANNAQNAADFQTAEKQLADGYAAVRASKDAFATAITAKQATISQLSQDLY